VPVVDGVVDEPAPVLDVDGVVDVPEPEGAPIEPAPMVESVPVVPVVVPGVLLPVPDMPVPDVPVLSGVVVPMLDVSVVAGEPEFVVAFSGDFAGSLSPPHAIAPATRATLRTT
jgi:hypothetical protein